MKTEQEVPKLQKELTDVHIVCTPPASLTKWVWDWERKASLMEDWAKEMVDFVRDHRSRDPMDLEVVRTYRYFWKCPECGLEHEVPAGQPPESFDCQNCDSHYKYNPS